MGSPSSIFSSDTLTERVAPTRAFLIALGLCFAVRMVIFLSGPGLSFFLGGWAVDKYYGYAYQCAEDRSLDPPRYLLTGSSRVALGLDPAAFARAMGVEENRVAKLTFPAGSPWELLKLMEAHPHLLEKLELVVMDVGFCMFNESYTERFGERFPRLADFREQVTSSTGLERIGDALNWCWPAWSERRTLVSWALAAQFKLNHGRNYVDETFVWDLHEQGVDLSELEKYNPENSANRHMNDFVYSTFMEQTYQELADLCWLHGIRLVLSHPPLRSGYLETVYAHPRMAAGCQRILAFLDALAELPHVCVIVTESAAEVTPLAEDDFFLDYGHLTRRGAAEYTWYLASRIQSWGAHRIARSDLLEQASDPFQRKVTIMD